MKQSHKWIYVCVMSLMTGSAVWACQWQVSRYNQAVKRWSVIRQQLKRQNPDVLNQISNPQQLYTFKYLGVRGTLSKEYQRIDRTKDGRMGYLIVRALKYTTIDAKDKYIAALEGWCSAESQYSPQIYPSSTFKGILREKQKRDYVHKNFSKQQLARYKMNTYINLQETIQKLGMTASDFNSQYYLQLMRPLDAVDEANFPYQYSVNNFELPYLTPDKHLTYAGFWACCTVIGITTILKALRLK